MTTWKFRNVETCAPKKHRDWYGWNALDLNGVPSDDEENKSMISMDYQ